MVRHVLSFSVMLGAVVFLQGCGEEGAKVKVKVNGKEAEASCDAKKFSIGGKKDEKGDACCEEIKFKDECNENLHKNGMDTTARYGEKLAKRAALISTRGNVPT